MCSPSYNSTNQQPPQQQSYSSPNYGSAPPQTPAPTQQQQGWQNQGFSSPRPRAGWQTQRAGGRFGGIGGTFVGNKIAEMMMPELSKNKRFMDYATRLNRKRNFQPLQQPFMPQNQPTTPSYSSSTTEPQKPNNVIIR